MQVKGAVLYEQGLPRPYAKSRPLRIETLELEVVDGTFTGRTEGILNMREGKLDRLREWLFGQALDERALANAAFYSDSANDLPLLEAVGHPVVVDPDLAFERVVRARGWPVLRLVR